MIGISRTTLSNFNEDKELSRKKDEMSICDKINSIHQDFPTYGYRRIKVELGRRGTLINHKKVSRIMKENCLNAIRFRRFIATTNSKHSNRIYPNLLKNYKVTKLNEVWVTDITYIRISTCFVYLAAIIDRLSRKVVGWAISKNIDTELCLSALNSALNKRRPEHGCIHHSDQGVQYTSHVYIQTLLDKGFQISMSSKGNPYDNAFAETFFKTLKYEEVHLFNYETYEEVIARLPFFIEEVYNKKRIHSSLGYITPNEFEAEYVLNGGYPGGGNKLQAIFV